jgi:hypothetical protein
VALVMVPWCGALAVAAALFDRFGFDVADDRSLLTLATIAVLGGA